MFAFVTESVDRAGYPKFGAVLPNSPTEWFADREDAQLVVEGYNIDHELEYRGWPGDGSGEDDLADYNQNEADDYRNE